MSKDEIPKDIKALLSKIKNKRARIVIDHIIKHGQITTEELEKDYGYNHAPRAARDVREAGIPLITTRVKSKDGERNIAAYRFGDFSNVRKDRLQGRVNWPKKFKQALIKEYGEQCLISGAKLPARNLQIDHRVPYEISGDPEKQKLDVRDFMLLSSTSNRAKSWSCEYCINWKDLKDINICRSCYWAFPEDYSHVAMREIRRLDITWQHEEVNDYESLKVEASELNESLPEYVKRVLRARPKK